MSTVPISGIGNIPIQYREKYTEVWEAYLKIMERIAEIMNKSVFTEQDAKDLEEAINAIVDLAKNGIEVNGRRLYLDEQMAGRIDRMFSMMDAAGIKPGQKISLDDMMNLKNISLTVDGKTITFAMVMANAINKIVGIDASLQGMLETIFVRNNAGLYIKQMAEIEEKLKSVKATLDALRAINDAFDKVEGAIPGSYKIPPTSWDDVPNSVRNKLPESIRNGPIEGLQAWLKTSENYENYVKYSKEYFGQELGYVPIESELEGSAKSILAMREALKKQMELLKAAGQSETDTNSLLYALKKVVESIDAAYSQVDLKQNELNEFINSDTYKDALKAKEEITKRIDDLNKRDYDLAKKMEAGGTPEEMEQWRQERLDINGELLRIHVNERPAIDANLAAVEATRTDLENQVTEKFKEATRNFILNPKNQDLIQDGITGGSNLSQELQDKTRTVQTSFDSFQTMANMMLQMIKDIIKGFASGVKG